MSDHTNADQDSLRAQVSSLEVRLRWALVALGVVVVGLITMAITGSRSPSSLSLHRLALVDSLGREVAVLSVDEDGPSLRLAADTGKGSVRLGLKRGDPTLEMRSDAGYTVLNSALGPQLMLLGGGGYVHLMAAPTAGNSHSGFAVLKLHTYAPGGDLLLTTSQRKPSDAITHTEFGTGGIYTYRWP